MGAIERRWLQSRSRRRALSSLAGLVAGSPLLGSAAQQDPRPLKDHRRTPGLDEMFSSFDFEPVMFANVPLSVYDYTAHGDGSEFTLRRNREAFDWVDLAPARAIDRARVDLSSQLLGLTLKYPIMVAPTAAMVPLHPDGEAGMHRAATAASTTPMIVSQNTSMPIDRIAPAATGPLWWQLYPYPPQGRDVSREVLDKAQAAGCSAVVVTVDQQASYYERTAQDRNLGGTPRQGGRGGAPAGTATSGPVPSEPGGLPRRVEGPALYRLGAGRLWYTWKYLDEVRQMIKVPLVVKGILTAEDAALCLEHGVDAIVVSNHGGRSMDYGPSTLEVLPEIVAAVKGRVPVLTDSGYRRGADILKALALGANAVLLGRTTRWALAAFGPAGAQKLLEMMQQELVDAAAAAGRATVASIDATVVKTSFP
jgi:isopentenyl diphosphate isomerase/L-lactate dehydrogenase-like FMN-dependent dehydrogenase